MKKEIVYWTTKEGEKIDVDKMDIDHLRNVLKMIIRKNKAIKETEYNLEPYHLDYLWKD